MKAATLKREYSDAALQEQANRLYDYAKRGGGVSHWLQSKGFLPGDAHEILIRWARMVESDE